MSKALENVIKLNGWIDVKSLGAKGDGVTDDTAALQAAINTGKDVVFPAGNYLSGPLTQTTNFQRFHAIGQVNIVKNANGVLLTSSGIYVELNGLQFVGTGFTGDNINSTGSNPRFINCSSYGTPGRAIKATGSHVQILGTSGVFATTDATSNGFDIEIGVSGTATLYHELHGVYSSQATGGILMTDVGSHTIIGGQFGKLSILSGTSPAGVNGGKTIGSRILGNVVVGLSTSVFVGNQFGSVTITFNAGTSGHSLDASNVLAGGASVVNNGNANSIIMRATSSGSTLDLSYGESSWTNTVKHFSDGTIETSGDFIVPNNKALKTKDSTGTVQSLATLSSNDDFFYGAYNGANFTALVGGSAGVFIGVDGTSRFQSTTSSWRPFADDSYTLGNSGNRYTVVWATTGTINTSDAREKTEMRVLSEAEMRAAKNIRIGAFQWLKAIKQKGEDNARIHCGVIAQEVAAALQAEGLDPGRYAFWCADEISEEVETHHEDGSITRETRPVLDENGQQLVRYGVRMDQILAFKLAAMEG